MMGYTVKCCNCKKEIDIKNKELFFVVQPTIFEDNAWKRVTYGGFKQFMLCTKCIRKKKLNLKIKNK